MKSRYAHIHSHTEFSALDGLSTCGELASRAAELGHSRVAITDHGTCAGHMEHQRACDAAGIMPVFGMEAYFREDRTYRPPAGDKEAQKAGRSDYEHLILLAVNDQGLHDLWALSTEGFRSGFYYVPRIDWDVLEEYGSNLICTTACLGGIVSRQLLSGRTEEAMQRLDRLRGIFGNRLYLEVGANDQGNQIELNKRLALIGGSLGIQLIAASDSHFARPEDAPYQEAWLRCQTRGEDDYWHLVHAQSDDEAFELLRHLGDDTAHEAMHNAAVAAALCDARIRGSIEPPVFTGSAREDGQLLLSSCLASWDRTRGRSRPQREYIRRFEREFDLLIRAGYCGYYNIVADYCGYARNAGILVGPGRGSGAGSLVAYLSKITGVDPLEHELLFERFLTEGRIGKSLPDFDVDFPASKRSEMQDYVTGKYGEERVVRVGTQGRYRNRGIIHKLMSVMEHDNWARAKADGNAISQIIDGAEEHTAGLGLTWDELHAQAGPLLEPYALRYPDVFRFAGRLAGRLSSYGRHASGVVISPDVSLAGRLPLRIGDEGDPMISQFGFEDLEWLGLTKFDFLTLRTLDTLQETADAVQDRSGRLQQMNDWSEQYEDPQVWDLISSGRTLGLFQLETSLCARMCTQLQPRSLEELAALIALVRPGPRNSGITRNYLERKGGRQEITTHDERITGALSATLGLMVYQEDVLRLCQVLAGYSLADADDVRKILGKKKTELINAEGDRFLSRCQEKGMPLAAAKAVWAEMAEFARYGFNRSHAFSYAVLGYWTAWFKAHYPVEFYTALLSTVPQDRCPAIIREAQGMGIAVLPPDINESRSGFTSGPMQVRYGLLSIKDVGEKAVESVLSCQPFTGLEDFTSRKGGAVHAGIVLLLAKCGALDSLLPEGSHRSALVARLEFEKTDLGSKDCRHYDSALESAPVPPGWPGGGCGFDWLTEPPPVSKTTGKALKGKPPPKKCTRACRQYDPHPPPDFNALAAYTPAQVRELELETLAIWLSSTPFDDMDDETREYLREQAHLLRIGEPGTYRVSGVIREMKLRSTRAGTPIGFMTLEPEEGDEIEIAVFADQLAIFRDQLEEGAMILAKIRKQLRQGPEGPEPRFSLTVAMKV